MINANFSIAPLSGDVFATVFSAVNLSTGDPAKKVVWSFGTPELIYDSFVPTYVYKAPGTYIIQLTAIDYNNNVSVASAQVVAELPYRDYIIFTHVPDSFPDPGKITDTPFKIEVVSSNFNIPLVIDLHAANSNSTPIQFVPDKWNFLTPTWKFLDSNLNTITSLSVDAIPIYKNNTIVAVSGTAEFYYIDSTSTGDPTQNCPVLITATLQTSGFNNIDDSYIYPYPSYANTNTLQTGVLWLVNDLYPNVLRVTGNYIDTINQKQWTDVGIPVLITCHSNKSLTLPGAKNEDSEVLFSYPQNNTAGKKYPVYLTLNNISNESYTIEEQPLYFQASINNARTGGYIFTTITSQITATDTTIIAKTTAFNPLGTFDKNKFTYPFGYVPSESVWVSNPTKNTLNKITLIPYPNNCDSISVFKENRILLDGRIKEIPVPYSTSHETVNYELSGFSGIYGIAIDPRFNEIVACDAELDRLYRISNSGEILKTFELTSLGDFDRNKKMFEHWTWTAISPTLSSSRYALYGPRPMSPNPANFIVSVGGVIQSTDSIGTDTDLRTIRLVRPLHIDAALSASNVPLSTYNTFQYPPEGVRVDAIQIFNPTLPNDYVSTIYYWTTAFPYAINSFLLSANPFVLFEDPTDTNLSYQNLNSNPHKYFVSIGGILQRPTSYTIDPDNNIITFAEAVPPQKTINIIYAPKLPDNTTSWTRTYNSQTNEFSFKNLLNFIDDPLSTFLVTIGGMLQSLTTYNFDYANKRLVFSENIPANTVVNVIQYTLSDSAYVPAAYTPTYVSLDKDYNIWVSLFNSVSVLKFDKDFNLLYSVVPENIEWLKRAWTVLPTGIGYQSAQFGFETRYDQPSSNSVDEYTNEFFLKPPVVETDRENNCWVTYANPLCSLLVKYSSSGEILSQISLDPYTMPINVAITPENNVWVANFHGSSYTYTPLSGSLQLYDSITSTLLSSITGISRPGHLTIDRDGNLWFSHSLRRIGYLNTKTAQISSWTIYLTAGIEPYIVPSEFILSGFEAYDSYENHEDDEIGGLAVDVYNRVWIIDNLYNYVWVVSATPNFLNSNIRKFQIRPNTFVGYYPDINTGATIIQDDENYLYRSAQATGDWTGNRWYQKYATPQLLSAVPLSGVSNTFNIEPFINKNQLRLQNETFNMAEYFHSLALPENLFNNNILFNNLLPGIVGTSRLSSSEDMGQVVYEKIANFTSNHGDIDTCNIDQLLSLAEQAAVPAADYGTEMPGEIRRMLDITSIPRLKLWGIKNPVPNITNSIGARYNTLTDNVTAGTKIILRNKFDSTISLIQVPQLEDQNNLLNVYPLKDIKLYGFVQPVIINYLFYRFEPRYDSEYVENLIDWSSDLTTLNPELSTNEDWYGDGQAIETAFRYLLTKNLFLK